MGGGALFCWDHSFPFSFSLYKSKNEKTGKKKQVKRMRITSVVALSGLLSSSGRHLHSNAEAEAQNSYVSCFELCFRRFGCYEWCFGSLGYSDCADVYDEDKSSDGGGSGGSTGEVYGEGEGDDVVDDLVDDVVVVVDGDDEDGMQG